MTFDRLPVKPAISRFVAPWDASGWYYMDADLQPESRVYSNADIRIAQMPDCLRGCDHIVTYDSAAEGFDDKQEVDFYTERRAAVYVALDGEADPSFLTEFAPTDLTVTTDAGDVYTLYRREFDADRHVHIDGFSGPGRHFFAIVEPLDQDAPAKAPTVPRFAVDARHQTPQYAWYIHESFNLLPDGSRPDRWQCAGDAAVQSWNDGTGRKCLKIGGASHAVLCAQTTGQDLAEAALTVTRGEIEIRLDDIAVRLTAESAALPDGSAVNNEPGGQYVIGFKRFPARQQCEIWINDRPAAVAASRCSADAALSLRIKDDGEALIDRVDWKDQTDVPFIDEKWADVPTCLRFAGSAAVVDRPAIGPCLRLDGEAAYSFPAVSGQARIELIIKPDHSGFTLMPELRDSLGNTLLRAAMYANNLFISEGGEWRRVVRGQAPWNYYPCDNWYHIAIAMDMDKQTFDVIVDGACRARSARFACDAHDVAQIVLFGQMEVCCLRVLDVRSPSARLLPPGPVFDARDFGAAGDGVTLDTAAIQRAVDASALTNGTVMLKNGVFHAKQIDLRSDMTLWVDETACLRAYQQYSAYPHPVPGESLCAIRNVGRALVYGERLRNVCVTGGGMLDANGRCRFKVNDPKGVNKLYTARPDNLYIAYSDDIRVSDISLCSAAYWTLVPLSSRHILLEHLDLDCMNTPNRDGIDPVECVDLTAAAGSWPGTTASA
ncbi:MAG: hypothetical protein IJ157_01995 [Clostridia bacterium]|nr:hypothetical protein [Clostridia bacterium]